LFVVAVVVVVVVVVDDIIVCDASVVVLCCGIIIFRSTLPPVSLQCHGHGRLKESVSAKRAESS
jgi:hypothetical protein